MRHRQLQRHLRSRRGRNPGRAAVGIGLDVLIAGSGPGHDLGNRSQFLSLRPGRNPPPRPRRRGQVTILQISDRSRGQPRGQVRPRRQVLGDQSGQLSGRDTLFAVLIGTRDGLPGGLLVRGAGCGRTVSTDAAGQGAEVQLP